MFCSSYDVTSSKFACGFFRLAILKFKLLTCNYNLRLGTIFDIDFRIERGRWGWPNLPGVAEQCRGWLGQLIILVNRIHLPLNVTLEIKDNFWRTPKYHHLEDRWYGEWPPTRGLAILQFLCSCSSSLTGTTNDLRSIFQRFSRWRPVRNNLINNEPVTCELRGKLKFISR